MKKRGIELVLSSLIDPQVKPISMWHPNIYQESTRKTRWIEPKVLILATFS